MTIILLFLTLLHSEAGPNPVLSSTQEMFHCVVSCIVIRIIILHLHDVIEHHMNL